MWWKRHQQLTELLPARSHREAPSIAVDDSSIRTQLRLIEERAYKTYRARQSASERLDKRARAWNWALIALATSTTIAAVGMMTDPTMYGPNGDTILVIVAILSLVFSLTTANRDYSGRSRNMFLNYRKLQKLCVQMEELSNLGRSTIAAEEVVQLSQRYQAVLDETENHTAADHLRHFSPTLPENDSYHSTDKTLLKRRAGAMWADRFVTFLPYGTLLLPLLLLAPLVINSLP